MIMTVLVAIAALAVAVIASALVQPRLQTRPGLLSDQSTAHQAVLY